MRFNNEKKNKQNKIKHTEKVTKFHSAMEKRRNEWKTKRIEFDFFVIDY